MASLIHHGSSGLDALMKRWAERAMPHTVSVNLTPIDINRYRLFDDMHRLFYEPRSAALSSVGHELLVKYGLNPIGIGGFLGQRFAVRGPMIGGDPRADHYRHEYVLPEPTAPHYRAFLREALELDGINGLTLLATSDALETILSSGALSSVELRQKVRNPDLPQYTEPEQIISPAPLLYLIAEMNGKPMYMIRSTELTS